MKAFLTILFTAIALFTTTQANAQVRPQATTLKCVKTANSQNPFIGRLVVSILKNPQESHFSGGVFLETALNQPADDFSTTTIVGSINGQIKGSKIQFKGIMPFESTYELVEIIGSGTRDSLTIQSRELHARNPQIFTFDCRINIGVQNLRRSR